MTYTTTETVSTQKATKITFYSAEGEVCALLEEVVYEEGRFFEIKVVEGPIIGRAMFCQYTSYSVVKCIAYDNIEVVLRWLKECRHLVRLPL